jgi:hypothetical protein
MCSHELAPGASDRSLAELEREICELAGHLAAGTCRWLLLLAEFDRLRGWAEWGVKSCAHWLSWRCSIAPGTAREHVRVARRLEDLPLIQDSFASGELSYCKVRALTRVATPQTETGLLEVALNASGGQLERLMRGYGQALRASTEQAQAQFARRRLTWYWDEDGSLRFQGRLPGEMGRLVLAALAAAAEAPDAAAGEDGADHDTLAADALVHMAGLAVERGSTGSRDGTGRPEPWELVVHVDAESLGADRPVQRCELGDGPALAPETVRRIGCDAALVTVVERGGEPLSVGRRTRRVPPSLRRALRSRDGGCRWPGCDHRRFLHAHHIQHWARGGETSLENLVQLCSHHHRLVHEGGFVVEQCPDSTLRFRSPSGRLIPARCPVEPVRGPGLRQQHRRRGVAIDERTCMPRSAGQRLELHWAVGVLVEGALAGSRGP